jgi:acyl-CoA thioesterase
MMADLRDPLTLARKCADVMMSEDKASSGIGVEVVDVGPGRSTCAMTVTERMVNGHNICHGGFIFLLADSAFAYACNTYGQREVAQHCAVTFLAPGRLGMRLTARCVERQRSGRSGIYDVAVCDETGATIAEFRGHSRTLPEKLIPET